MSGTTEGWSGHGGGPLSVCLVSAAYLPYPSGVSEHVAHLATALTDLGQDVDVLTTRFGGGDWSAANGADSRIPVRRVGRAVTIPGNGSYATLPVGLSMPHEVRAHLALRRPDVVHCHGFMFPEIAYWALRASGSTNVVSLMSAGFRAGPAAARLFRAVFGGTTARISAVIALSGWAQECHQGLLPGPFDIVPPGIDLERFRPSPAPLREAAGPIVLFVGRLDARKGAEVLVRAMPAVLAAVPAARLVVVGDGPRREAATRLAGELGIAAEVEFVGRVDRASLPRYYSGASVYVSPALGGESFGIVLLEALASGTPVVASGIRGYDEVVRPGEGLLVRPDDAGALAAAVERVLVEPGLRARLAEAGLARAREHAWPEIARRTLEIYDRALTSTSS